MAGWVLKTGKYCGFGGGIRIPCGPARLEKINKFNAFIAIARCGGGGGGCSGFWALRFFDSLRKLN